jgi:hypothetical protein
MLLNVLAIRNREVGRVQNARQVASAVGTVARPGIFARQDCAISRLREVRLSNEWSTCYDDNRVNAIMHALTGESCRGEDKFYVREAAERA